MNQPGRVGRFAVGCLASLGLGCLSQALMMARSSSGAVDRDAEFRPQPGTDGHFISLPAYPLANCTDTLVYEKLLADFGSMIDALGRMPLEQFKKVSGAKGSRDNPPVDFLSAVAQTHIGQKLAEENNDQSRRTLATQLGRPVGAAGQTDLSALLDAGGRDKFDKGAMASLLGARREGEAAMEFATSAAEFARYANDYGRSACASAQGYHDFLGFRPETTGGADKPAEISWLNVPPCQQIETLRGIAKLAGVALATDDPCTDANLDVLWPRPVQSFLHFSDVQIREPSAKLGGTKLSHDLKKLVNSFEQDYVQDQYALFVYDALVKTVNAEVQRPADRDRPPPALMIHTGDSVDTGLQSEFDTFTTLTNHLNVPWYQAVGNHDVVAFGNLRLVGREARRSHLEPQLQEAECHGPSWNQVACSCTSIGTLIREKENRQPNNRGEMADGLPDWKMPLFPLVLQRVCLLHAIQADWFVMDPDKAGSNDPTRSFIQSHCKAWHPVPGQSGAPADDPNQKALNGCLADAALPATRAQGPCATLDDQDQPDRQFHGFQLIGDLGARLRNVPQKSANAEIGYYCFEIKALAAAGADAPTTARKIWAIVLNTNSNEGSYGYLSDEQLNWLNGVLTINETTQIGPRDLVMLFSHHPVWSIYDQRQRLRLTDIVTRSPNVIGYFAGHIHEAGLRVIRPLSGSSGTPKWEIVAPSVIDYPQAVRQVTIKSAGGLGYLEILTFTSHGSGPSVERIKAAEQGAVRDRCASQPERCVDGRALLPGREIEFPRLFFRLP